MKEQIKDIEFRDQKIVDVNMEAEVKKSFIEYAMSVIISRALPDARDGLKPVHRRILYSMFEEGLTYDKAFRKSATTVGYVIGHYHPHGDSAVYDAMVRLAQDFSLRYPLVDGHGNFGNIDGDGAAAYRYTEARMTRIANHMLSDIRKDTVPFTPNFDNQTKEPEVLPARFPNLLVNGSMGIAVGMATNIPPHNLSEVIDGTIALIDNPDIEIPELMEYIKGPDFPTAAAIYGTMGIREAYMTGKGRLSVRAKAEIDEEKHRIIITEIPYGVNKANLDKAIGDCYKEKKVEGITAMRDESSDRVGIRIVIEHRKDVNGQILLNQLYKYTQLQDTFAVNMLALVNGEPKVLNLKQILQIYIEHQQSVIIGRTKFEQKKALHDAHINEGFKIAIDNIDEVIRLIRASASVQEAKEALMARFTANDVDNLIGEGGHEGLSEIQAQAIVEMPLGRLAGLERKKIEDTLSGLMDAIRGYEELLHSMDKVNAVIREDLLAIKARYGDERRTEIVPVEDEIMLEDLIERHTCVVTFTRDGYIKRQPESSYNAQKRGGKGVIGMKTKEEDDVVDVVAMHSHSDLMLFTNLGKVHVMKAYAVPEVGKTAKGSHIANLVDLQPSESITAMLSVQSYRDGSYLTMITGKGIIKRAEISDFAYQRKGGKIALSLDEGDYLAFVLKTDGSRDILLATRNGNATRFSETRVRVVGRSARGVIGIELEEGDRVAGAAVVDDSKTLLTISENGYGKRTAFSEFRTANRGGKGVIVQGLNERTGLLSGIAAVSESDDVMMITASGTVIRTPVDGINLYSRTAAGVILMRIGEGDRVMNFSAIPDQVEEAPVPDADIEEVDALRDTEDAEEIEIEDIEENTEDNE